ncbi:MAG: putative resolvase [Rubritepida sp.]|nr:putative resolvase [Rubritepida sp.]
MPATLGLIDGNSFYCSCERAFAPKLRGKALVVLSNNDGNAIARTTEAKAAGVKMGDPWQLAKDRPAVLSMGGAALDTRTPTGKHMLTMLRAVAEFERGLMLERQREGIAKAKAEGKHQGRAPTALRQAKTVRQLKADGMKPTEIAVHLGIDRASVYRILGTSEDATPHPA